VCLKDPLGLPRSPRAEWEVSRRPPAKMSQSGPPDLRMTPFARHAGWLLQSGHHLRRRHALREHDDDAEAAGFRDGGTRLRSGEGVAAIVTCKSCIHAMMPLDTDGTTTRSTRFGVTALGIVTVLGLVGGVPGGETPRVADSSAAGAGRFFHNSVPPSKQNRLGKLPRTMCNVRPFNQWIEAASVLRH